jgi:hypothetical protein
MQKYGNMLQVPSVVAHELTVLTRAQIDKQRDAAMMKRGRSQAFPLVRDGEGNVLTGSQLIEWVLQDPMLEFAPTTDDVRQNSAKIEMPGAAGFDIFDREVVAAASYNQAVLLTCDSCLAASVACVTAWDM